MVQSFCGVKNGRLNEKIESSALWSIMGAFQIGRRVHGE